MPTYVYQCQDCGITFDVRASIREKEAGLAPECPECDATETQQVITASLFIRGNSSGVPALAGCGPNAGPGCCG